LQSKIDVIKSIDKILKENTEQTRTNRLVYHIPLEYIKYIKNNGYQFSKFVNEAIKDKINKEIKNG